MNRRILELQVVPSCRACFCILLILCFSILSKSGLADQISQNKSSMVLIPGGEFIMGSTDEELRPVISEFGKRADFHGYDFESEKPQRKIHVKDFYIDRYEVSNAQYKVFLDATGHSLPSHWHPVIKISWHDANAYASWAGKRLPSEEEWEKAARGTDGRIYPWGVEFDPANSGTAETTLMVHFPIMGLTSFAAPIDAFAKDRSPYGVMGMTGNVMEWTGSWYEKGVSRVVKGGSWVHLGARARSASRVGVKPDNISHLLGFRCAKDAVKN